MTPNVAKLIVILKRTDQKNDVLCLVITLPFISVTAVMTYKKALPVYYCIRASQPRCDKETEQRLVKLFLR